MRNSNQYATAYFRLLTQITILTVFGFFLSGCESMSTPAPSLAEMDKSPFTGIPCEAPCWQGLEVGKSSESDVLSVLPNLSFIDQGTVIVNQVPSMPSLDPKVWTNGVRLTASCLHPKKQCLTLMIADNVLTDIEIKLNYEISVEETIEFLGTPSYLGYVNLGAEKVMCDVYLVWMDKNLILSSRFEGPKNMDNTCRVIHDTGRIFSNLIISNVKYSSNIYIENLMTVSTGEFFEFTGTISE